MNEEELNKKIMNLNAHIKILQGELKWQDILDMYSYKYGHSPRNNEVTVYIYEKGKLYEKN
jgi:hypothetical protein